MGLRDKNAAAVGRHAQDALRDGDQVELGNAVGEAARRAGIPTLPTKSERPAGEENQ